MSVRTRTLLRESERKRVEYQEQQKKVVARERGEAARFAESAAYHAALKRKYLRAVARPWKSVEPDPPPPELEARGPYWEERGEYRQALAAYEEALRDDPENENALNGLAWFLATCPEAKLRDGKRAVELATCAVSLPVGRFWSMSIRWRPLTLRPGIFQLRLRCNAKRSGCFLPDTRMRSLFVTDSMVTERTSHTDIWSIGQNSGVKGERPAVSAPPRSRPPKTFERPNRDRRKPDQFRKIDRVGRNVDRISADGVIVMGEGREDSRESLRGRRATG